MFIGRGLFLLRLPWPARFLCDRMASRASWYASVDVKKILREKIYEKMLALGASYKEHTATSEVVQMSGEGVEQLEIYFGKYLPQLFYSLLAPVTLFLVLSRISLKASVILSDLCAADSAVHRGGAEDRRAAVSQILGILLQSGGCLSGESPGTDHLENLSGGCDEGRSRWTTLRKTSGRSP